ncbi:hypothetical protein HY641_03380, partial [Candidatus Woesearchaeota archaeon]|nr:hypothetical protein [Candidatus Woesearchaeota archaeon]
MPNYLDDIRQGLYSWVMKELKITTLFAEQYEMRPQKTPYAVIRTSVITAYGVMDESAEVDNEGLAKIDGHRKMFVNLEIVGQGANEKALQLQASLSKVNVLGELWNVYGIAILDRGDITNITELLETKGLERAGLDIKIGYAVQYI